MALYRCTAPQLAAIASISFLPGAVLSVPFGRWIDRVGSKKVLCVGIRRGLCLSSAAYLGENVLAAAEPYADCRYFSCTDGRRSGKAAGRMVLIKGNAGRFRTVRIFGGAGSGHRLCDGKSVPERKSGVSGHCRFTAAAVGGVALERRTGGTGAVNGSAPAVRGMPSVLRSRNLWKVAVCAFIASGVSLVLNTYLTRALTFKRARCPRRQRPSARS